MKILSIAFLLIGTGMRFATLGVGETLVLDSGINWVSVQCADCDIIQGVDTLNVTNIFTFPDYIGQHYDEITIISNAADTKIAYRYDEY